MNDDILQKQVLSSTIEFRVSDTVQEFKMFNKSLFLHLPYVINHMGTLWEFISVSITNTHSKSLINDCCLLNLTVNQLQQAAQEWATYRPLCGLVSHRESLIIIWYIISNTDSNHNENIPHRGGCTSFRQGVQMQRGVRYYQFIPHFSKIE